VVHNGIIENFRELREALEKKGAVFKTETDTEIVLHLVDDLLQQGIKPVEAVRAALSELRGAFALGFIFAGDDDLMIGARNGPPLAIGHGDGEMYLGSDAIALGPFTDTISYLEGRRLGGADAQGRDHLRQEQRDRAARGGQALGLDLAGRQGELPPLHGQGNPRAAGSGRPHPGALRRHGERARRAAGQAAVRLQGYPAHFDHGLRHRELCRLRRQILVRAVRARAGRSRCRLGIPLPRGAVAQGAISAIFISQSGETADTLAALRYAKGEGVHTVSVVNVPTSTIARESETVLQTLAGPKSASPRPRRSPAS
jgi:glucosamine--fructose-6-phosphate aminotransferase (isomerizing)